jgi:hypothetical protein
LQLDQNSVPNSAESLVVISDGVLAIIYSWCCRDVPYKNYEELYAETGTPGAYLSGKYAREMPSPREKSQENSITEK